MKPCNIYHAAITLYQITLIQVLPVYLIELRMSLF